MWDIEFFHSFSSMWGVVEGALSNSPLESRITSPEFCLEFRELWGPARKIRAREVYCGAARKGRSEFLSEISNHLWREIH